MGMIWPISMEFISEPKRCSHTLNNDENKKIHNNIFTESEYIVNNLGPSTENQHAQYNQSTIRSDNRCFVENS